MGVLHPGSMLRRDQIQLLDLWELFSLEPQEASETAWQAGIMLWETQLFPNWASPLLESEIGPTNWPGSA